MINNPNDDKDYLGSIICIKMSGDPVLEEMANSYPPEYKLDSKYYHITLLALSGMEDKDMYDSVVSRLSKLALEFGVILGEYNGYAWFNSSEENELYPAIALFDSPQLTQFKNKLDLEFPEHVSSQTHGFVPHTTLAYVPHEHLVSPSPKLLPYKYIIDKVSIFNGSDTIDIPMYDIEVMKELPIDDKSKYVLVSARINIFNDYMSELAEKLFTGDMSIGQWEDQMKIAIKQLHTATAAIGKGGWSNMTYKDWGTVGSIIKKQYGYLHGFAKDIADNRNTISVNKILARSKMYGNAAANTALRMQLPTDILSQLPYIPRDGSTECLTNCHCQWDLKVISSANGINTIEAVWKIGEAEHCMDCVDRIGKRVLLYVSDKIEVPDKIGGY